MVVPVWFTFSITLILVITEKVIDFSSRFITVALAALFYSKQCPSRDLRFYGFPPVSLQYCTYSSVTWRYYIYVTSY